MKLYSKLAGLYDLLYEYKDYNIEVDFLVEHVKSDSPSFLDVGCGTGSHLKCLRSRFPNSNLTGIDLNKNMLEIAESKNLQANLVKSSMQSFNLKEKYDIVYCYSSSIQYNLSKKDLTSTLHNMLNHSDNKVIFDLAFCKERWKEGYTNITANSNNEYQVAELYTSHSSEGISQWNPIYLIKDNKTGILDMQVDNHKIRLWSIGDIEGILDNLDITYKLKKGFREEPTEHGIPVFILEV